MVKGREGIVEFPIHGLRLSWRLLIPSSSSPLLVVGKPASIEPARVRRLSWRSKKTIVSTTIHGYEGSGRVFAMLVKGFLPYHNELQD